MRTKLVRPALWALALASAAWLAHGCRNFTGADLADVPAAPPPDTSRGTTPPANTGVCFTTQILPLFQSSCAQSHCHDSRSHEDGYDLTSYASIVRKGISPGNPDGSKLYASTAPNSKERMPPPPQPALTDAQRALLKRWIAEGAKNTDCSSASCDTLSVTYSKTIAPFLQTYCVSCHSASLASGGIILTSYSNVKTFVDNGKFWGSINRQSGYMAMPPDIKLDACALSQSRAWIHAGAPNN